MLSSTKTNMNQMLLFSLLMGINNKMTMITILITIRIRVKLTLLIVDIHNSNNIFSGSTTSSGSASNDVKLMNTTINAHS